MKLSNQLIHKRLRDYAEAVTVTGAFTMDGTTFSAPAGQMGAETSSFRSSAELFEASGEDEEWLILAFFFFFNKPDKCSLSDESELDVGNTTNL